MFTVFLCRKCGHNLYVEESPALGEKLGEVAVMPCPNCGEEGYENWKLLMLDADNTGAICVESRPFN